MNTTWRFLGLTWVELASLLFGLGMLVVELVALVTGSRLISPTWRTDGQRWAWEPAVMGVLCGHFYGPAWIAPKHPWGMWVALGYLGVVLGRDLFIRTKIPIDLLWVTFLVSVVVGAFFWAQGK